MKFDVPNASRKHVRELLDYLSNPCKNYAGNRADDFKKCFNINSKWCWKYAYIVLRGLKRRKLVYAERHHIIPAIIYGKRWVDASDERNLSVLRYCEHLYAHYCAAKCAKGNYAAKHAYAFCLMYYVGRSGKRQILPNERKLIESIPEKELNRLRVMVPKSKRVEAEGRPHYWEGHAKAKHAYYTTRKDKIISKSKQWYDENKSRVSKRNKEHYELNKEEISKRSKAYRAATKDKKAEYDKEYRKKNKARLAAYSKEYSEKNKDKVSERCKRWRETHKEWMAEYRKANKEKIAAQNRAWREKNKQKLAADKKAWREKNLEKITLREKQWRDANKEMISLRNKEYAKKNAKTLKAKKRADYEAKVAAGYRYRLNHVTGKREWIYAVAA